MNVLSGIIYPWNGGPGVLQVGSQSNNDVAGYGER